MNKKFTVLFLKIAAIIPLILFIFAASLPFLISSQTATVFSNNLLTKLLNRPISIGSIEADWQSGISIKDITITELEEFKKPHLLQCEEILFSFGLLQLHKKQFPVLIEINGLSVHFSRLKNGHSNISALLTKSTSAPSQKKNKSIGIILPQFIYKFNFKVQGAFFDVADDLSGHRISLTNINAFFNTQSLLNAPVDFLFEAESKIDDVPVTDISIKATIEGIFNERGLIQLEKSEASFRAKFPGVYAHFIGDMNNHEAKVDISVNTDSLTQAFAPFLPAEYIHLKSSGEFTLSIEANKKSQNLIHFSQNLLTDQLAISGLPKGVTIPPFDLSMSNIGEADLDHRKISIESGFFKLNANTGASWELTAVESPKNKKQITAHFFDILLYAEDLLPFVKSLPAFKDTFKFSQINLPQFDFQADFDDSKNISFQGKTSLLLPDFQYNDINTTFSMLDLQLSSLSFSGTLANFSPQKIQIDADMQLEQLKGSGKENFNLKKFKLGPASITANFTNGKPSFIDINMHPAINEFLVDNGDLLSVQNFAMPNLMLSMNLKNNSPSFVQLTTGLAVQDIYADPFEFALESLTFKRFILTAENLSPLQKTFPWLTGQFDIDHHISLDSAGLGDQLSAEN